MGNNQAFDSNDQAFDMDGPENLADAYTILARDLAEAYKILALDLVDAYKILALDLASGMTDAKK